MKFTIERKPFLDALAVINRITPAKSNIPIISNVLLSATGSILELRGSDLDIDVTERIQTQIDRTGSTTVSAKMLLDIVRKMPDGSQIIAEYVDGKPLSVRAGRSRFSLQTLPESDFPDLNAGKMDYHFEVPAAVLGRALEKTSFAVSTEETRYYLNGVHFHIDGKKLVLVATDGHRLAKCDLPAPDGASDIPAIIVPRKTVGEIQKLIAGSDDDHVSIALSSTKIRFQVGDAIITSKLIDGRFPDYKSVIPKGQNLVARIDTEQLVAAAGRVATVATDRGRAIKLAFGKGLLSLSQRSDIGESEEEIEIDYDAADITIGFNSKYLQDILAAADSEVITVAMNDPGAPALFHPVGQDDVEYIAMPMLVS